MKEENMAQCTWRNVLIASVNENGPFKAKFNHSVDITVTKSGDGAKIELSKDGNVSNEHALHLASSTELCRLGRQGIILTYENEAESLLLKFDSESDCRKVLSLLKELTKSEAKSVFTERTDKDSATQYFQFYSYLSQQQNMMQDYVRTNTYQRAMLSNVADFSGKVVLDVGAGSGILSFFAIQAGAKRVYAVEASNMAPFCERLVKHNGLSDRVKVISAKIEEVELPEKVDTIISEPIGYMLFNERMIESYLHAKKFLKPGGKMFPTEGHLFIAPFNDDALYQEQSMKPNFWCQDNFHGVNLTTLRMDSFKEVFKQPIVDTFHIGSCLAPANKYPYDFLKIAEQDLYVIDIPLMFSISTTGTIHGLAFWFDLAFIGSQETVWLSTAPMEPLTHWYQVRCLLQNPVFVKQGQQVTGRLTMRANSRQSYDVEVSVDIPGTNNKSSNTLDLKNPYFRYGGQVAAVPVQNGVTSPTEQYYTSNGYQTNMVNTNGVSAHEPQAQNFSISHLQHSAVPPINPGCIPSLGINMTQQQQQHQPQQYQNSVQNRTSIGGGLAPTSFSQPAQAASQMGMSGLSNTYMIGDYAANLSHRS